MQSNMCGIFLLIEKSPTRSPEEVGNAFDLIQHRGPDSSSLEMISLMDGVMWAGFHRLTIRDHTHAAAMQP